MRWSTAVGCCWTNYRFRAAALADLGPPPDTLRGDKAYSAKAHRDRLRARGVKVVIPEKTDQQANRKHKGSRDGRPVGFDSADYKDRNVVERAFNKLKNWRGLAARNDKHALIHRGGMVLASIILWLTD
jgi:transposase